jgi:3-oxoacyl-[acyl-carrier protein] reductase
MDLRDRVTVIVGAASGIGRVTSELAAERGAIVVAADVDEAGVRGTAEAIRRRGGRVEAVRCDVRRREDIEAVVDGAVQRAGRLDIVINTAGILRLAPIVDTADPIWNEVLAVNLTGAFHLTRAALRAMRGQGKGAIVHIASRMAIRIKEGHAAYAASKAGILQLTQAAAIEGAPHGIRVNCVCPGYIETPMQVAYDESALVGWKQTCPLGRAGQPEEVGRAMLFLASDEASFITGVALAVDGGRAIV